MGVLAGAAEIRIPVEPGVGLMGYGARVGTCTGIHDPLHARALYLGRDGESEASALIVAADLCLMAPQHASAIRVGISARTGLDPQQILVSCTHTHSAPSTGLDEFLAGEPQPDRVTAVFARIQQAGVAAFEARRPAALKLMTAEARIGRNRRIADGPLDPEILILRVDTTAGQPLAILFHHGCHGTVLGHDNLEASADWAGAAARRIASVTGAMPLFLLGAHADIDPRTRGLMDLAIPGQSLGLGFDAVRVLGEEVADAVIRAASAAAPPREASALPIGARSRRIRLPLHLGDRTDKEARVEIERRRVALADLLDVAIDGFPRLSRLDALAFERARGLPVEQARSLLSQVRVFLRDKTAPFFVGGSRELDAEIQAVVIGEAVFLGLPFEPTTNVGLDWKRRMRGRSRHTGVCGIANGWLRYLPHAADLAHPDAERHYEVLQTLVAPGAAEALLKAGEDLVRGIDESLA